MEKQVQLQESKAHRIHKIEEPMYPRKNIASSFSMEKFRALLKKARNAVISRSLKLKATIYGKVADSPIPPSRKKEEKFLRHKRKKNSFS